MAKELEIPVIALSQLNRGVEARVGENKRPMLSDLRESGAIEQDADMVILLHRPEYYGILQDEEGNSTVGMAELIVAKNRNGQTGTVKVNFKGEYMKFVDYDYVYEQKDNSQSATESLPFYGEAPAEDEGKKKKVAVKKSAATPKKDESEKSEGESSEDESGDWDVEMERDK